MYQSLSFTIYYIAIYLIWLQRNDQAPASFPDRHQHHLEEPRRQYCTTFCHWPGSAREDGHRYRSPRTAAHRPGRLGQSQSALGPMNGSKVSAWLWALYSKPEKKIFIHESLGRVWVWAVGHRGELSGLIWFMSWVDSSVLCLFFFGLCRAHAWCFPLCMQHECSISC